MSENKTCTTRRFSLEGSESPFASHDKAMEWAGLTDSGLRLRCGELTANEIRTIRAVLASILNHPTNDAN